MSMVPRVREMWTRALRSGFFKQGQGYLSITESQDGEIGDCCLGVLCKLAVMEGIIPQPETGSRGNAADGKLKTILNFHSEAGDHGSTAFLPLKVVEWAGLDENDDTGTLVNPYTHDDDQKLFTLVSMNDAGIPFDKIADVIDEQF